MQRLIRDEKSTYNSVHKLSSYIKKKVKGSSKRIRKMISTKELI